jgi:proteasome accessory factor C
VSAPVQVDRIVLLVAELTRRDAAGGGPVPLAEIARDLGVSTAQVLADLRTLTEAQERQDGEWLDHLSIALEGDTVQLTSRGPFRRPIRLTTEELMAIQVGLESEPDARALLAGLAAVLAAPGAAEPATHVVPAAAAWEETVVARARRAMDERRVLAIRYAGERDRAGTNRIVEPHGVVYQDGRHYIQAYCRLKADWRHFRADRVLDVRVEEGRFTWRDGHRPIAERGDVFRVAEAPDDVRVRFGAGIARWLLERYPDAERRDDGAIEVVLRVSEPAWLVRHLLQYGAEAEVVAPKAYREIMRRALQPAV